MAFRDRLPSFREPSRATNSDKRSLPDTVAHHAKHIATRVKHHSKKLAALATHHAKHLATRVKHHSKKLAARATRDAQHVASRATHHASRFPGVAAKFITRSGGAIARGVTQLPGHTARTIKKLPAAFSDGRRAITASARNFSAKTVDKIIGVVGEALMTAGVFVLLFLGWHVWYNDVVSGIAQNNAGSELSDNWANVPLSVPEFDRHPGDSAGARLEPEPPITASGALNTRFATLIVPRFGETFERAIAEGIDPKKVLNVRSAGLGHYPQSNDLGEIGNFAIAGHRTTYGAPLGNIDQLRVGDRLYVETEAGWYVYRYRNLEYVWPKEVAVIKPVPQTSAAGADRLLTLTSCHPKLSSAERVIAYSVFETFVPRDRGAPAEVAAMKAAG